MDQGRGVCGYLRKAYGNLTRVRGRVKITSRRKPSAGVEELGEGIGKPEPSYGLPLAKAFENLAKLVARGTAKAWGRVNKVWVMIWARK